MRRRPSPFLDRADDPVVLHDQASVALLAATPANAPLQPDGQSHVELMVSAKAIEPNGGPTSRSR